MAKISAYDNYKTGKASAEIGKFEETGVIPVSGKYTADGKMETKNVPMSELLGGGGGGDSNIFVGTLDTTFAEWKAAAEAGKVLLINHYMTEEGEESGTHYKINVASDVANSRVTYYSAEYSMGDMSMAMSTITLKIRLNIEVMTDYDRAKMVREVKYLLTDTDKLRFVYSARLENNDFYVIDMDEEDASDPQSFCPVLANPNGGRSDSDYDDMNAFDLGNETLTANQRYQLITTGLQTLLGSDWQYAVVYDGYPYKPMGFGSSNSVVCAYCDTGYSKAFSYIEIAAGDQAHPIKITEIDASGSRGRKYVQINVRSSEYFLNDDLDNFPDGYYNIVITDNHAYVKIDNIWESDHSGEFGIKITIPARVSGDYTDIVIDLPIYNSTNLNHKLKIIQDDYEPYRLYAGPNDNDGDLKGGSTSQINITDVGYHILRNYKES